MIGDIHGRDDWKKIIEKENADRYIFIGDYFDSYDIPGLVQMHNFKEIMMWSEKTDAECVFLIGNHDYHYFDFVTDTNTSGYQYKLATSIKHLMNDYKDRLQMAYQFDDVVCSHAGISEDFMNAVFGRGGWNVDNMVELINEKWKYQPKTFEFGSYVEMKKMSWLDPTGDNVDQSPTWIRPRSLMKSNYDTLRKKVIQVAGHTIQRKIDIKGMATGGRYYFIDTLETSGEYLIHNDDGYGKFSVNNLKEEL